MFVPPFLLLVPECHEEEEGAELEAVPPEMETQADYVAGECGADGGVTGIEGEDMGEPTVIDLANILRANMGQQQAREAGWEQEVTRQEQRFKTLQHQFNLLFSSPAQAASPPAG